MTTAKTPTTQLPSQQATHWQAEQPDISHLITEDETPVDNLFQEKQQRLLTDCLYSSFAAEVPFLAAANVGLFYDLNLPPLVPDTMLSLDVELPKDWSEHKESRSYFVWLFGKPPEVAIEVVSNKKGNELGSKLKDYATAGVLYYAVYDPRQLISTTPLQVLRLDGDQYRPQETTWMEHVSLGLTVWTGQYEGKDSSWLRWQDADGNLLLTGKESAEQEYQRAEQEHQRAEQEHQRAEQERQRAEQERERADRLTAFLKAQGINPEDIVND